MNVKVLLPVVLLALWIGGCAFMSHYYCCGTPALPTKNALSLVPIESIEKESSRQAVEAAGFSFPPTNSNLDSLLTTAQKSLIAYTTGYLQNHPKRCLVLTGLYTASEKNINANIGLERATSVQQLFLNEGIANTQIKLKQDMTETTAEQVENAVEFDFEPMLETEKLLKAIELNVLHPKIVIHFDLDQNDLSLTPAQERFFQVLQQYMEQKEEEKLLVIGFTDNQGEARQNFGLGRERAAFVKDELVEMGFDKRRVMSDSQGEKNPIATNETEEGRAMNRRVEVEVKR
ncbi:MAG: OmpA family protein [Bacteroidota bacterium]